MLFAPTASLQHTVQYTVNTGQWNLWFQFPSLLLHPLRESCGPGDGTGDISNQRTGLVTPEKTDVRSLRILIGNYLWHHLLQANTCIISTTPDREAHPGFACMHLSLKKLAIPACISNLSIYFILEPWWGEESLFWSLLAFLSLVLIMPAEKTHFRTQTWTPPALTILVFFCYEWRIWPPKLPFKVPSLSLFTVFLLALV